MELQSRRQLLKLSAAGATVSVAGCSSLNGSSESESTDPQNDAADSSSADSADVQSDTPVEGSIAVAADISDEAASQLQQEAQQRQQEIRQQLEDGELNQTQAQEEYRQAQSEYENSQIELIADSVEAVETHIADTDGLEVKQATAEAGALLVDGGAEPIVGLLSLNTVAALLAGGEYSRLTQQQ